MPADPGGPPGGPDALRHLRIPVTLIQSYARAEALAAWQAREAAIAGLLNRIQAGTSKVRVVWEWNDPRFSSLPENQEPTFKDRASEDRYEAALRKQAMQYFEDLARTEAGFRLLSDLEAS